MSGVGARGALAQELTAAELDRVQVGPSGGTTGRPVAALPAPLGGFAAGPRPWSCWAQRPLLALAVWSGVGGRGAWAREPPEAELAGAQVGRSGGTTGGSVAPQRPRSMIRRRVSG